MSLKSGIIAATLILPLLFSGGGASADSVPAAPAPFDRGGVKIALVSYISAGDFFQAYQAGVQAQARALGVDLRLFPGRQDAAQQREQILQAINLGVQAIIVDHGQPEALGDVVQQALDRGIKVVAFDVNLDNPAVPQIEQSDQRLAELVLDQALKDNGPRFAAGYAYVAGFAPLDRRDEVWQALKARHEGIEEKARFGVVSDTAARATADQAKAVLQANPQISVVFAPWDEFARGVKLAAVDLGLSERIRIYSADISTADIQEIVEPGSPWVATAATNPSVVGAVSLRAAALAVAGEPVPETVVIEPVLLTQTQLRAAGVQTLEELAQKIPAFATSQAATASWIPAPAY